MDIEYWLRKSMRVCGPIFGHKLSARVLETQTTRAWIRCLALNKMSYLGMPKRYPIA